MNFNKVEMTAFMSVVQAMMLADGRIDRSESIAVAKELFSFGVPSEDVEEIISKGIEMEPSIAVEIISKMRQGQKKYIAAFLGTIIAIDGKIDDKEIMLWRLVSRLCGLPTMDINEAIQYYHHGDY